MQKAKRVFETEEILGMVEQLVSALEHAHEHSEIVHRDLKPANLMIDGRSRLKITDFGIARSISDSVSRVSVRQPGSTSGSPPYMSPQQCLGHAATVSDDIYSLGATIYDLLTSKPPFYTGNIYRQIEEIVPPSMAQRRQDLGIEDTQPIPAAWEEGVAACLAKNPEDRPSSARELLERLQATPTAQTSRVSPLPVNEKSRSTSGKFKLVLAGLVFIGLLGVGWFFSQWQESQRLAAVEENLAAANQLFEEGKWTESAQYFTDLKGTAQADAARVALEKISAIQAAFKEADKAVKAGTLEEAVAARSQLQELKVPAPFLADLEGAIQKLENQKRVDDSIASARQAIETGGWDTAIQAAESVLRLDPENTEANALLKEARAKQSEVAEAEIAKKLREAQRAMDSGRSAEARQILTTLLKANPGNPAATRLMEELAAVPKQNPARPSSALPGSNIRVTNSQAGPILSFPNGQRLQIPGSDKGLLGPSSDPGSQVPHLSPNGKVLALTTQPGTQPSNPFMALEGQSAAAAYLVLADKAGRFGEPIALNPQLAGLSLPGLTVSEDFIRVQKAGNDAVILEAIDPKSSQSQSDEFALTLNDGQPVFPDGGGFFSEKAVFVGTAYAGFNTYSKNLILRRVQEILKQEEFYKSSVDGAMGRGTQAAIFAYQSAKKLLPSGLLNATTLSAMGLNGISEKTPPPAQNKKAAAPRKSPSKSSKSSKGGNDADSYIRKQLGL